MNDNDETVKTKSRVPKKRLTASAVLLFLGGGGLICARTVNGFADLYGFEIYPYIQKIFAGISGLFPFSLGEIMIIAGVLLVLFSVVYFIVGMVKRKGRRLIFLASSGASVLFVLSAILFMFTYGCGINYSRKPFSEIAELKTGKYTKEQLLEVLEYTVSKMNSFSLDIVLDEDGHTVLPGDLSDRARAAMTKLSEKYPSLDSYYPPLKPVMMSELMCYGHITGVFSFFSMESNYNQNDVPENRGFVFCHELSHMTGFMREDEANFISCLACAVSGDAYLGYSGCYNELIYLLNAYYPEVPSAEYSRILSMLPENVLKQMRMENEFWDKYKTDFGEAAEVMNDVYLKINHQSDGTKSYGRVVDLLIADYYANISVR